MFKYKFGQFLYALNMVKNRSVHNLIHEAMTNYVLLLLSIPTETKTFDLLVYMLDII